MGKSTAKNPNGRRKSSGGTSGKELPAGAEPKPANSRRSAAQKGGHDEQPRRNGGWREIEALREKAALRASLADVWDEDFDLDEEILAELDHTAEFFTSQEQPEEEIFDDDEEEDDEFFEDDEV